jgi:hypothetical protein
MNLFRFRASVLLCYLAISMLSETLLVFDSRLVHGHSTSPIRAAQTIPLHDVAIAVLTQVMQSTECASGVQATYFHYFRVCGGPAGHSYSVEMTYFPNAPDAAATFDTQRGTFPLHDFHGYSSYEWLSSTSSQMYHQEHTWLADQWIITAGKTDAQFLTGDPEVISEQVYDSANQVDLFSFQAFQTWLPLVDRRIAH